MFDAVHRSIPPQGDKNAAGISEALQGELLPLVKLTATGSRLYAKPRGYAGDYQTIDMIYDNVPAGAGPVGALARRLRAEPAGRQGHSQSAAPPGGGDPVVLPHGGQGVPRRQPRLRSGARDLRRVRESRRQGAPHVSCIDVDREALTHIGAQCQKQTLGEQVRTLQANLIQLATGRQELELAPQDLIYSVNFIDYLSDELAIALIDWTYDKLRPGGRVILGNFHPRNPTRGFMDHVLDWHLTHRDEAAMNQLFAASKFAASLLAHLLRGGRHRPVRRGPQAVDSLSRSSRRG